VSFLAEKGARLDAADANGRTALDFALGRGTPGRPGAVRSETAALLQELLLNWEVSIIY
jgi:hypothetical protein